MMIRELNHIGIRTGNMEASRALYEKALGGVVIRDYASSDGKNQFVYIQLARGVIELILVGADAPAKGYAHAAFLTDQKKTLEDWHAELANMGYQFTVQPKTAASGDGRLAFYLDKSGAVFELIERTENIRLRDHVSPVLKAFNHTAVYTTPEAAAVCADFYRTSMGLYKTDALGPGQNIYTNGEDSILLLETEDPSLLATPLHHMSFCVEDCAALRDRLIKTGIACTALIRQRSNTGFAATGCDGELLVFTDRLTKKQ